MKKPAARAWIEAARNVDELSDADLVKEAAQREVLAEGDEPRFVVTIGQRAAPIDDLNRVDITRARIVRSAFGARSDRDQGRAAMQKIGNLMERLRNASEKKRESRFRPNQRRHIRDAGRRRRRRAVGEVEIAMHDRIFVLRPELGPLSDV